jgi:hypothetical protein
LFKQPEESDLGECPICCLPFPLDESKSMINTCCGKRICKGCSYANIIREEEQGLGHKCAYCREPLPKTEEEMRQNYMERVKANDPIALYQMGGSATRKGTMMEHLNIGKRQLHWGMLIRITICHVCIVRDMVLRRMKKGSLPFGRGCHWWSSRGEAQSWML